MLANQIQNGISEDNFCNNTQPMRPFYLRGTENGLNSFMKVVITKSMATVDFIIRTSDNSWTIKQKVFDLSKDAEHKKYVTFLETNFESSFAEFDTARRQMNDDEKNKPKEADTEPKPPDNDPVNWRQEILKKISEFRQNKPDENKDE